MLDKQLGWELGFPTGGKIDRSEEIGQVTEKACVISLIVEEVLAHPPTGDGGVDTLTWIEVLSVASLCFNSCARSAEIHNQLTRTASRITEYFEVQTLISDEPTDVDLRGYQQLRAQHMLPAPIPITTGQGTDPGSEKQPQPIGDRVPRLTPIDTAMREALGFGIDAA